MHALTPKLDPHTSMTLALPFDTQEMVYGEPDKLKHLTKIQEVRGGCWMDVKVYRENKNVEARLYTTLPEVSTNVMQRAEGHNGSYATEFNSAFASAERDVNKCAAVAACASCFSILQCICSYKIP